MTRSVHRWLFCLSMLVSLGCATEASTTAASETEALSGSDALPRDFERLLGCHRAFTRAELDRTYELHHDVRVGRGRTVHVTEVFTLRSWLRRDRRAVVMLPGTLSLGSFFNLDVEGYRFQDTLAQAGYFTFAVDYEGSGGSTFPADGYAVTHDYLVDAMRPVVSYVRLLRLIPRVDILGESNGGSIASELCDDRRSVRSCVLSSMLYAEGTDFFNAAFLDPGFVFFLTHQPNGYLVVGPELYFNITSRMSPDVSAATLATQPGRFAMGPVVVGLSGLPWFDPTHGQVPAIIIQGTQDDVATQADADALAAAYGSAHNGGGHATVVRIAGAGLIPRTEPAPYNDIYTDDVIAFLDHH